jgi:hypothetical protein
MTMTRCLPMDLLLPALLYLYYELLFISISFGSCLEFLGIAGFYIFNFLPQV